MEAFNNLDWWQVARVALGFVLGTLLARRFRGRR